MKIVNNERGFTLIELLVVIAIIGILSSVVLASLNSARGKGSNAAIKANLSNMRAEGALFADNNSGNYTGFCSDSVVGNASTSVASAGGSMTCQATASLFSIVSPLKVSETGGANWCVDSNGYSGYSASTTATAANCK
jgi:prepilin-type N-terminal cleavage/methylation domain-containing protein